MQRWPILLLVLATLTGCAGGKSARSTSHVRFDKADEWAEVFEDPTRDVWQKPRELITVLGVAEGEEVADLGAGTGYFTEWLGYAVAEKGVVYAVDVEPDMLRFIGQRDDIVFNNVQLVLAEPDDPKLPEGRLELILIGNTWHHIDKRDRYLERLAPALSPSGRVAVIDWHDDETPVGPPLKERLPREQVVSEFEDAGWELASESVVLPYQYVLVFTPPRG